MFSKALWLIYCLSRNWCVKLFLWNLWYSIFLNSNRCEQFFFNQLFCITRPRSDSRNSITHFFIRYSFSHTLHTLCQADRRGAYKIVVFIYKVETFWFLSDTLKILHYQAWQSLQIVPSAKNKPLQFYFAVPLVPTYIVLLHFFPNFTINKISVISSPLRLLYLADFLSVLLLPPLLDVCKAFFVCRDVSVFL